MSFCLVVRYPQESGCGSLGFVGYNRCLASPGRTFDGSEGVLGHSRGEWFRHTQQRTGWYEPVEVITPEEAIARVAVALWDSAMHEDDPTDESRALYAAHIVEGFVAQSVDDFTGLAEHYPTIAGQIEQLLAYGPA